MFFPRWLVLMLACCVVQMTPHANALTIEGDKPRERITVHIQNASVESVLRDLSRNYGFEIRGLSASDQSETLNTTMSGNLQIILTRLLRNRDHVIVRSPDNHTGVEKVILLGEEAKSRRRIEGQSNPSPPPPASIGETSPYH